MKKYLFIAPITIAGLSFLSSCGRTVQGPIALEPVENNNVNQQPESSATTQPQQQVAQPKAPGTFNPPNAGVKVTSANTVIQGANANPQANPPIENTPANQTATSPNTTVTAQTQDPVSTPNTQKYTVQKGDTISVIANEKYGIKVAELLALNNGVSDKDEIQPGQVLFVPNK